MYGQALQKRDEVRRVRIQDYRYQPPECPRKVTVHPPVDVGVMMIYIGDDGSQEGQRKRSTGIRYEKYGYIEDGEYGPENDEQRVRDHSGTKMPVKQGHS